MKKYQIIIMALSIGIGILVIIGSMVFLTKKDSSLTSNEPLKTFTLEEVTEANGEDGKKCYVVLDKTVYEISQGNKWREGEHITSEGQAYCGRDLTDVINKSPHGKSVLTLLKEVGVLQQ